MEPAETGCDFSKAAKYAKGKHKILNHRNSILSGKAIFRLPDDLIFSLDVAIIQTDEKFCRKTEDLAQIIQIETEKLNKEKEKEESLRKKKVCSSYAFKVLSRKDYEDKNVKRYNTPGAGHYNINYDAVFKYEIVRKKYVPFINKEKVERHRANSVETIECKKSESRATTADRGRTPVIDFSKQISRKTFIPRRTDSPHENRFVSSDLQPEACSKFKRSHTVDISKSVPRDDKFFIQPSNNLSYNPNKEIVLRRLAKDFSIKSMSSRKDLYSSKQAPDSKVYSTDLVYRKYPSPDFSKLLPRAKHSDSPIPIFMQGLGNRSSLNSISHKTLQQNSYSTRDLYAYTSTFDKPKGKKVRKDVFKVLKEYLLEDS